MSIIVSGQTFNYREALKDMGGKWNNVDKNWLFPDTLSNEKINYIKRMTGVQMSNDRPKESAEEFIARIENRPSVRNGSTNFFGDDMTYFNYFADKNPISFFGFSSLGKMIDYIEAIPQSVRLQYRDGRNEAWTNTKDFSGVNDMDEAIDLARNGWSKGISQAKEILDYIEGSNALHKKHKASVAGGRVNVGRMLSGNPLHMMKREKQPGRKIITVFVETAILSKIKPETTILKAACTAAIVDVVEQNNFSCELVSLGLSRSKDGKALRQVTCKLKNSGEKLNLNDLIFALGHSAYHRKFNFALAATDDTERAHWHYMGVSRGEETFENPNEFYIPRLTIDIQNKITGSNLKERALSMIPLILPSGLPIEVR
jgi:hypothetical protein